MDGVGLFFSQGGICKTIQNGPDFFSIVAWDTWQQQIQFV
jgi:hypothetical protein